MTNGCRREFEDSLLTGFLDAVLTQGDEQRVRLHLEECSTCRKEVEEMRSLRELTLSTRFRPPPDDGWDETPRGGVSRLSLRVGWAVLLIWLVGVFGFALGQVWSDADSLGERLLLFGGLLGGLLVLLSVLIDRLKSLKDDRYRRVKK
ncbi:MAG: zf-HC2 domain-containing protein [Thermoanaerobaculia bacterium]|nr:zf-HC2 domain-containing protein [Thermoanaerobaculia bacterium]